MKFPSWCLIIGSLHLWIVIHVTFISKCDLIAYVYIIYKNYNNNNNNNSMLIFSMVSRSEVFLSFLSLFLDVNGSTCLQWIWKIWIHLKCDFDSHLNTWQKKKKVNLHPVLAVSSVVLRLNPKVYTGRAFASHSKQRQTIKNRKLNSTGREMFLLLKRPFRSLWRPICRPRFNFHPDIKLKAQHASAETASWLLGDSQDMSLLI